VLPPAWLRRTTLGPGMVLLTFTVLTTLPLWLVGVAVVSPALPGSRWRLLRVLWVVLLHMVLESIALVVLLGLWLASGFGARIRTPWFERAHYRLIRWYLRVMMEEAERVLGVRVAVEGPEPSAFDGRPLVVFSRHAGPGDSFLVVHALMNWYRREPRIVLKDTLQWDPVIDILLNRLPNLFVSPGRGGQAGGVAALAADLDDDDAFVIFPEGGNFTARRRARAITRLREKGLLAEADKAEQLRHVLAPRPGGVVAALAAGDGADVVWLAHSGLDHLISVGDVWRALPMDTVVRMRWWHVSARDVPEDRRAQVDWLYSWWARIDDWVGEQRA
jgi:1-acyl-sn-glycerol-3-phosphate acyltransferase